MHFLKPIHVCLIYKSSSCDVSLQGIAPLTLNLVKPDPVFDDNFMPLASSKEMPIRVAMSNSFGFGGTNASLLFASVEDSYCL